MSNRTSFCVLLLLGLLAVLSRNSASALWLHHGHIENEGPTVERLEQCRSHLKALIQVKSAHALFVRLAWHDSGTFDKSLYPNWPRCGGANGSIRFGVETNHEANKGLHAAVLLLEKVKFKFPEISYADIYQMASATAIQLAGGPVIPMRYGRLDADSPQDILPAGNLPKGAKPFPIATDSAADHLRRVFHRMGLTDQDIVVLSGAHTIGRAHLINSGFGKAFTKYTLLGPGVPGGTSWTPNWMQFDNSYYNYVKNKQDQSLLVLETDAVLFEDPHFMIYAEKYLNNNEAFLADYAVSHSKLSELGVRWGKTGPISL